MPDGNSSQILETAINNFTSTMTSLSLPTEENIKVKKLSEQLAKNARELGAIFRTNLPTYATYDEPIPRVPKICSTYLVIYNGFLDSIPGFTYETVM